MSGETDLAALIASMEPMLDEETYVFCTFSGKSFADLADLADVEPIGLFAEKEGLTAILPSKKADDLGLPAAEWYARITLGVHSSLEAVGLTAAVATELAQAGIPANVVAAYFHDHVFVPAGQAAKAMAVLRALSAQEGQRAPH